MSERLREGRFNNSARKDWTREDVTEMFNDFAEDYDEQYLVVKPSKVQSVITETICGQFPPEKRPNVKIIDVAAGTGILGQMLKDRGFAKIDALDPADKMLDKARSKNIYQRYYCQYMDGHTIEEIQTDEYDLLTICMGLNTGLIPLAAFQEMIRIVKPGGRIVFSLTDTNHKAGYNGELLPLMDSLIKDGVLEQVVKLGLVDGETGYKGCGPGCLCMYRVLVSQMTQNSEK